MRFLHTGDLHIGKSVNEFSMIEDQRYILKQITELAEKEGAEAVVIAGDVYDRAIPPAEAVTLLDEFLLGLQRLNIKVIFISGNHDSPERIGFAEELLQESGIYIAGVYKEGLKEVTLTDGEGRVTFVLMPFVKPAVVGAKTSGEAAAFMLEQWRSSHHADKEERLVLVTHYFVTNDGKEPELSDGETTVNVGGLDNVELSVLEGFDYVALGHIHRPQQIGSGQVYYAGAPLGYSFSEAGQKKYVNLVELSASEVSVSRLPLSPLHQMRRIRGKLEMLITDEVAEAADRFDYIQATLTNEEELIDPIGTLRSVYPNIMQIMLAKNEAGDQGGYTAGAEEKRKSIPEFFEEFYLLVRGEEPDEERKAVIAEAAKEAEGDCR